jgi:hypothetical protein
LEDECEWELDWLRESNPSKDWVGTRIAVLRYEDECQPDLRFGRQQDVGWKGTFGPTFAEGPQVSSCVAAGEFVDTLPVRCPDAGHNSSTQSGPGTIR